MINKHSLQEDAEILAHFGEDYAEQLGAVIPPIYMTSLHVKPKEYLYAPNHMPFTYGRVSNPTANLFERKIAALERAEMALSFASGMAAISSSILANLQQGDHIVAVDFAYGPTREFITEDLSKFGIEYTFVPGKNLSDFAEAIRPNTRLFYLESPSTAVFHIQNLREVAVLAKKHGIVTLIDNSWASPIFQKPIELGIDISIHSATKYIGGHSDVIAGVAAGRTEIMNKVKHIRENFGGILSPMDAWLCIRGLRTLLVRLGAHQEAALEIAARLSQHPAVRKVYYPGLPDFPQHQLAKSQMSGFTGLLSFSLHGGREEARAVASRLRWFNLGPSWGGFESMVNLLDGEEGDKVVRIHVGLEGVETLWADLKGSLDAVLG